MSLRFLSKIFSQPPDPVAMCHHDLLGQMRYVEDDEAWLGWLDGIAVSVTYTGQSQPARSLIDYGVSLAQDQGWLTAEIQRQSEQYIAQKPFYADEVRELTIGVISVYENKGVNKALIQLKGGHDYRAWRIEFTEQSCNGIGFDP